MLTTGSRFPALSLRAVRPLASVEEKIRHTIEAIQTYNEGKELGQMYRLSEANVRYLPGPLHGTIKAHPEIADYDKGYGFSVQHDRGKIPIAKVVEW